MLVIADTTKLVAEGVLTPAQAEGLESRARDTMIEAAVGLLLGFGILAATGGLIFWLQDAVAVAISGVVLVALGAVVLSRAPALFRMFGNAAVLIGVGMLIGGAAVELLDRVPDIAGPVLAVGGAVIALGCVWPLLRRGPAGLVTTVILLMGLAAHLYGLGDVFYRAETTGTPAVLFCAYTALCLVAVGWLTDLRFVTALAMTPFAQMLYARGGFESFGNFVFGPEVTLSILQMTLLICLGLWLARVANERTGRHAMTLVVLGFVAANVSALMGSLWGDVVGETLFGPRLADFMSANLEAGDRVAAWDHYHAAQTAFEAAAIHISAQVYSVLWALALAVLILWSAFTGQRGLLNASVTFAVIHAYVQAFESFADEPLAYVIAGLVAIPLAWGAWRANLWLMARGTTGADPHSP